MQARLAIAMGSLFLAAVPAWAHHKLAAEFDTTKQITLQGTVTRVEWINPHAWIHLDVTGPDGEITSWMVEGGPPNILLRHGLTKESLEVGTAIAITGYRAKDGFNRADGTYITFKDGKRLPFDGPWSADGSMILFTKPPGR